jgi:hypothetical protein
MGTRYPTHQETRAIRETANAGDTSAANYLKLLDACIAVLEASNGITLARGLVGEHDDVYGHAIDDALSDLVPVIVEIAAGGWESLKFYAPVLESPEEGEAIDEA